MGRVTVDILIANNQDVQMALRGALPENEIRHAIVQAVVDTAASHLVLPEKVATQLGLPITEQRPVHYADRRSEIRNIAEEARIDLMGRHGTYKAILEPNRDTALIGAIVLDDLDLLVDCRHETLQPRDPSGTVYEVE